MEERTKVVDYSSYLGSDTYTILMKTPNHFSKADSLIAPFSRQAWRIWSSSMHTTTRGPPAFRCGW